MLLNRSSHQYFRPAVISVLMAALFALALPAHAMECKSASVHFTATAQQEVSNDMVRLNWQTTVQEKTADAAMKQANKTLDEALKTLKAKTNVQKPRTNVQTFPQYGKNRNIESWQAVGTLSFDMPVQGLQSQNSWTMPSGLVLNGLDYFVSETVQQQTRASLLAQAMKDFQAKASEVAKGFGRTGYQLSELHVNDEPNRYPSPGMPRMMAASADSMGKAMEIAIAPGESALQVQINGRVCLSEAR